MDNLRIKLADEHLRFLQSPMWALIKYRLETYIRRQTEYSTTFTRNNNSHGAILNLGMADGAQQTIKLIEGLNKEIMDKSFDADAALHVIENKGEK